MKLTEYTLWWAISSTADKAAVCDFPADLQHRPPSMLPSRKGKGDKEVVAGKERECSLYVWQQSRQRELRSSWTTHLIKDVRPWFNRKHGEDDYYVAHLLNGHRYVKSYLTELRKSQLPDYIYCKDVVKGRWVVLFPSSINGSVFGHLNCDHAAERENEMVHVSSLCSMVPIMVSNTWRPSIERWWSHLLQKKKWGRHHPPLPCYKCSWVTVIFPVV